MKFSQIVFIVMAFFCLGSCQDVYKEHKTQPQKKETPSTKYQKTNEEIPVFERQKPVEKPLEKEVKKAKLKTIDTLKPLVAIP